MTLDRLIEQIRRQSELMRTLDTQNVPSGPQERANFAAKYMIGMDRLYFLDREYSESLDRRFQDTGKEKAK